VKGHTYGVDEAGRGPILGPMALAVVVLDRKTATRLTKLGVQDSKRFGAGPKAQELRASLAAEIHQCARAWACELVSVETIDEHTFRGQLNRLEQDIALQLLRRLEAAADATIICDGEYLFRPLREHFPRLKAVNDGESAHVAVAAASIVAKHARDTAFAQSPEAATPTRTRAASSTPTSRRAAASRPRRARAGAPRSCRRCKRRRSSSCSPSCDHSSAKSLSSVRSLSSA
jgi:ribonuclease HII